MSRSGEWAERGQGRPQAGGEHDTTGGQQPNGEGRDGGSKPRTRRHNTEEKYESAFPYFLLVFDAKIMLIACLLYLKKRAAVWVVTGDCMFTI